MMAGGEGGGKGSQDFELNIASIIDCLTVLIAFVLASASFLSISILDAGVAAAGPVAKDDSTPPPVQVTVELARGQKATVKLSGKENTSTPIEAKGGEWNYEGLSAHLSSVKAKYPTVNAVVLSAENTVEYKDVVKSMEVVRKTMPAVLLGGF